MHSKKGQTDTSLSREWNNEHLIKDSLRKLTWSSFNIYWVTVLYSLLPFKITFIPFNAYVTYDMVDTIYALSYII